MSATDLMVTIARIQQAPSSKRAQMVAEARAKFSKVVWSSDEMKQWSKWAFLEGTKQ